MDSFSTEDSGNEDSSTGEIGVSIDTFELQSHDSVRKDYEMLNPNQLIDLMREIISSVSGVTQTNPTILRLLLDSYQWDKDLMMETFFENTQSELLKRIKVNENSYNSKEGFGLLTLTSDAKGPTECFICSEEYESSQLKGLRCGHYFCTNCWQSYLTTSVVDNSKTDRITCPDYGCNFLVDDNIVEQFLFKDDRMRMKFFKIITNSFVIHNRSLTWCPGLDCTYAARSFSDIFAHNQRIECEHCQESFCFNCSRPWHEPVSCEDIGSWMKKIENDSGTSSWIIANTKECPKCKAVIEKSGGCNHMICQNISCKHEFCWFCLDLWEPHGTDWYTCNRFNTKDAEKSRKELDQSRAELNRYMFYFNRYSNHCQSLKFETKYSQTIQEKLKSYDCSYIDLKYIENSIDILCQCRRILMYTYVFAYYTKPSNHTYIFEGNQADLEKATEALSELLERDMDKISSNNSKYKLQDKTTYCESRSKVLLDHVEDGNRNDLWEKMYP